MKVLIVDDDAVSRLVLDHLLSQMGLTVEAVGSIAAAEAALTQSLIDLIICGHFVSGRNGLDLLDELAGCPIPFVLLAASTRSDNPVDSRLDAVAGSLGNPISASELHLLVNALVASPVL